MKRLYAKISDIDIVFLSYDEPYADRNWEQLLDRHPYAKRVHGVKGFDAAHKRAAEISSGSHFITVDADTVVETAFFDKVLRLEEHQINMIWSWSSRNLITGLTYGNGSIKLWPKSVVEKMNTHENRMTDNGVLPVEFCWELPYVSLSDCYSVTGPGRSALHAFRVGLREGVKLATRRGVALDLDIFKSMDATTSKGILAHWLTMGSHYEEGVGLWSCVGAHLGLQAVFGLSPYKSLKIEKIHDYDHLGMVFYKVLSRVQRKNEDFDTMDEVGLEWNRSALESVADWISDRTLRLVGIRAKPMSPDVSAAFFMNLDSSMQRRRNEQIRILFDS